MNAFIDHGEFDVMKILSGCGAVDCDKDQFHGENHSFELSLLNEVV